MRRRQWNPFSDVLFGNGWPRLLQEDFDQLFRQPFAGLAEPMLSAGDWAPAMGLYETDDAFTVEVDLPGAEVDSIGLEVHEELLTISAKRAAREENGYKIVRDELPSGGFKHQVRLPAQVDAENTSARYQDGVLTVRMPKRPETQPRRISVQPK